MSLDPSELFPEVPNLYEFPSVHQDMIYDEHRVNAYRRAIGATLKPGDVVVDVGTGTGLLAFLCVQAGASHVHAIERASVIEIARELAHRNGFSSRITFHHGDARGVDIPEKADLMVSELIGHMAFEEGMAETLFGAKKRFVKPGGEVIPQQVELRVAPVQEEDVYATYVDGWRPIQGIDYGLMREKALRSCYVTKVSGNALLANPEVVFSVDFRCDCTLETPETRQEMAFTSYRKGSVNGIALWFDAMLAAEVRISSGPWAKTHWDQVFAPIPTPISVNRGDTLHVGLSMKLRMKQEDTFSIQVHVTKTS